MRHGFIHLLTCLGLTLALCFTVFQPFVALAADDNSEVETLLARGEFAAALAIADDADSTSQRDKVLGKVASAQRSAGLIGQSLLTLRMIDNDVLRNRVLNQQNKSISPLPFSIDNSHPHQSETDGNNSENTFSPETNARHGAGGGAAMADFDPLIELIQNTIDPQSWLDTNGGPGTINEFRSGVTVDAGGTLRKAEFSAGNDLLKNLRDESARKAENQNVFRESDLRKISLNRLEKECQLLAAGGKNPTESMERLAGLYEIKYLLLYPETGDVVIAGPAGNWKTDVEGTAVNVTTGKPVFRLDDFVVCLRNAVKLDGKFGCSIDPRQTNLQATQEFIATSPLKGKRWRDGLRTALGLQDITVDGIDPQSVVARVIVEADYRMKLVGMDLEKGVPGVESFLSRVELDKDGNVPPQDVMRLEFVLNYENVSVTDTKDAYQLHGQGVKVISEQELLDARGKRIQTGKSTGPADEFARGFTKHFNAMAAKYPIYRQLKNIFDLAMVTNLIKSHQLAKKCSWSMAYFVPTDRSYLSYENHRGPIPKEVSTVMNYREIDVRQGGRRVKTHLVVGVSGGVTVDAGSVLSSNDLIKTDTYGKLRLDRKTAKPPSENWWWD